MKIALPVVRVKWLLRQRAGVRAYFRRLVRRGVYREDDYTWSYNRVQP